MSHIPTEMGSHSYVMDGEERPVMTRQTKVKPEAVEIERKDFCPAIEHNRLLFKNK